MTTIFPHEAQGAPLTEQAFGLWLAVAEPGNVIQYHEGFLSLDIAESESGLSATAHRQLVAVANLAWWASEERLVHLVQRRIGHERFAYLAVMRPRKAGAFPHRPKKHCLRGDMVCPTT